MIKSAINDTIAQKKCITMSIVLSTSPSISSYPEPKLPAILEKKAEPQIFRLQLVNSKTPETTKHIFIKTTKGVLNVWKDIMTSRLRISETTYNMEPAKLASDQKLAATYESLLESAEEQLTQVSGKKENKSRHIMLLTDTDGQIQGIASIIEKLKKIEVDTLISAPWNVPMNSTLSQEHLPLRTKGTGTTLMRQIYEFAKMKKKQIVELRPIASARSFYVDFLKMTPDDWTPAVRFTVSEEELPEALAVTSGNLLKTL